MNDRILARVRALTWVLIVGLVLSGVTAIPLRSEVAWLVKMTGAVERAAKGLEQASDWAQWILRIQRALDRISAADPFLFYGTDWLAFGHFAIALAFVGALRDPVRNRWVFVFGMRACMLLIPYALVFGAIRGVPVWWRMIDCAFGISGFIPAWLCWRWTRGFNLEPGERN